tara:strand:+ start:171 stop:518 length:348 start_codon:yes stop_codon:yes gene_type:complete
MPKKNNAIDFIKEVYPQTEQEFQIILNKMYRTFCEKQFDYGPGNIALGTMLKNEKEVNQSLFGIIVRMNDKINRLINLSTNHNMKAKNEPIDDAFIDIAVYAVMAMIVKQNKWGK